MQRLKKRWLIPALLYAAFFLWYTDLGGPLTEQEIDAFAAVMVESGRPQEQIDSLREFAEQDTGRQFFMVNNIELNENPPDVEGAEPGESAEQLMGRYMAHMFPALFRRACHPTIAGQAVFDSMDLVGIANAEHWDQGAMMRYRSRRDLLDIVTNPVFSGKHGFKTASLEKTIAFPIEAAFNLGDPRVLLALLMLSIAALVDGFMKSRAISGTQ